MRLIMLKIVVFPAPFGPMIASISWGLTLKLTPSTALSPPNCNVRSLISSKAMSTPPRRDQACGPLADPRHDGINAVRLEHQYEDEQDAEQKRPQARYFGIA